MASFEEYKDALVDCMAWTAALGGLAHVYRFSWDAPDDGRPFDWRYICTPDNGITCATVLHGQVLWQLLPTCDLCEEDFIEAYHRIEDENFEGAAIEMCPDCYEEYCQQHEARFEGALIRMPKGQPW